jgi:uncharacterized protein (TIGR00290 family)
MKILLAWSGGKDSTMALLALRTQPQAEVVGLLTSITGDFDRVSMHGVRRSILQLQAERLHLPLFEARLARVSSNVDYDRAWALALERAREALGEVGHIAYGDLYLEDVRGYREEQAERLGYEPLFPLWGRDTAQLAKEFVAGGHEAYLTCVDTTQLDAEFAGRRYDGGLLAELPASVDPCGEKGEFHTCVVGGPSLGADIRVAIGERVRRDDRFEYCDLIASA